MSGINITSVDVLDNPTKFTNPLIFEIQYECLQRLEGGAWSRDAYGRRGDGPPCKFGSIFHTSARLGLDAVACYAPGNQPQTSSSN